MIIDKSHHTVFARIRSLALLEFRSELAELDYIVTQYEKQLGIKPEVVAVAPQVETVKPAVKRRKARSDKGTSRSEEARERIRLALLKHWEEKKSRPATAEELKQRKSKQHRRAISRGMKKMWARKRKELNAEATQTS
jgi:hypothetical protein